MACILEGYIKKKRVEIRMAKCQSIQNDIKSKITKARKKSRLFGTEALNKNKALRPYLATTSSSAEGSVGKVVTSPAVAGLFSERSSPLTATGSKAEAAANVPFPTEHTIVAVRCPLAGAQTRDVEVPCSE